jgi:hypothetical protein
VIWEPFLLALVLGIIVSAGLYFAYLWPSVEPADDAPTAGEPAASPEAPAEIAPAVTTATDDTASLPP